MGSWKTIATLSYWVVSVTFQGKLAVKLQVASGEDDQNPWIRPSFIRKKHLFKPPVSPILPSGELTYC